MRDDLGEVEHEHAKITRCATSPRSKKSLLGYFYKYVIPMYRDWLSSEVENPG